MKIQHILLLKSSLWEILSAILGFIVVFLFTGEFNTSVKITLVLLVLKSILLAAYDYFTYPIVNRLKNNER